MVLFVLVSLAGGWLLTGDFSAGLYLGGGVFISWALSREIDPAHDYSAFIAAALSLFMFPNAETLNFLPLVWLLLLLRAINGITGKELTWFDSLSLFTFTVFLSFNNGNSIYLLLFALAMLFIRQTGEENKAVSLAFAVSSVLFILQSLFMNSLFLNGFGDLDTLDILVIVSAILSPIVFWFLAQTEAEDDKGNKAAPSKIFASQLLYSLSVLLLAFFSELTFANQIIYFSVLLGISFNLIGVKLFQNR